MKFSGRTGVVLMVAFSLAALFGVIASTSAQFPGGPPPGGFPGGGPPGGFPGGGAPPFGGQNQGLSVVNAPSKALAALLKLTDSQTQQIEAIQSQWKADLPALLPQMGSGRPDFAKMRGAMEKIQNSEAKASNKIKAMLTAEQKKQLPSVLKDIQIFQQAGLPAEISDKLNLTAAQKKQIAAIAKKSQQTLQNKMQSAMQSGEMGSMPTIMEQGREETRKQIKAVLTNEQNALVEAYRKDHPQEEENGGFPGGVPPGGSFVGGRPPRGNAGGPALTLGEYRTGDQTNPNPSDFPPPQEYIGPEGPDPKTLKLADNSGAEGTRKAIARSLPLLLKADVGFTTNSGRCTSCHHQALTSIAYTLGKERGFAMDEKILQQQDKKVYSDIEGYGEALEQKAPINANIMCSYTLMAWTLSKHTVDKATLRLVKEIASRQKPDGRFISKAYRPPLEFSDFTATAATIRAMQLNTPEGKEAQFQKQYAKAKEWLLSAKPKELEEQICQLEGLYLTKAEPAILQNLAKHIVAQQREDGGWAQLPERGSDAYATGHVLAVLYEASGMKTGDPVYAKGITYLLKTQIEDGSWYVSRRAPAVLTYFETEFPYGRHQFISCAGTAWATIALLLTLPPSSKSLAATD